MSVKNVRLHHDWRTADRKFDFHALTYGGAYCDALGGVCRVNSHRQRLSSFYRREHSNSTGWSFPSEVAKQVGATSSATSRARVTFMSALCQW